MLKGGTRRAAPDADLQFEHCTAEYGDARNVALRSGSARCAEEVRLLARRWPRVQHQQAGSHSQSESIKFIHVPLIPRQDFSLVISGRFEIIRHLQFAWKRLGTFVAMSRNTRIRCCHYSERVSRQYHATGHGHAQVVDDASWKQSLGYATFLRFKEPALNHSAQVMS